MTDGMAGMVEQENEGNKGSKDSPVQTGYPPKMITIC